MPKVNPQVHTRPPMQRMLQIHERIQQSRFPNCSRLAKEFEVCSRTIKRDIDFMKCRLNLPIEYDSRRYGFYYTGEVDQFPSLPLSEAEAFALLVAQKAIRQYQGTPFQEPLETAYRRLTGQLNQAQTFLFEGLERALSFRPFAPDDGDLEKFGVIYRGLTEHRQLRFRYRNLGATRTLIRQVNPYHLACVEGHWYLFAFDLRREAMRTFVLTRMTDVQVTDQTFPAPTGFDPNEYLKGSFSVFKGSDDYEVVIDFDRWAADLIRGRRWHASQELLELPKGNLRMRIRLNNIEEIERFVLSCGRTA
jgi:proteasome accessory factor B